MSLSPSYVWLIIITNALYHGIKSVNSNKRLKGQKLFKLKNNWFNPSVLSYSNNLNTCQLYDEQRRSYLSGWFHEGG